MKLLNNGGGGQYLLYNTARNLIIQKSLEHHNGLKNKLLNALVKRMNFPNNQEKL
ncbi:hypothetical protein [Helicobacter rodentium]|uniref:hypothetical protein n=1 Tax=Helicobacter rodentium TaxID=59617 RepID=UPI0023F2C638|nr:hypothetical protein [Helicobacter rodentium]